MVFDINSFWVYPITFLAGILSVFSPCILPILPGFIAYFAGLSVKDAKEKSHQKDLFISSLFFSLGFTLVFLCFGLIAGGISIFFVQNQLVFQQISGIILMSMGVLQTGLLKFGFLQKEFKINQSTIKFSHQLYLRSLLIGALFAFSWTPCYGPIIGGIFTLAASTKTVGSSLIFFLIYSLGFTLPIILLSLSLDRISNFFASHRSLFRYSNLLAGILLIFIGFLMFTNNLSSIVNWLSFLYTENKLSFF